jgi:polysaccharide biosynthesis protein PslH
MNILFVAPRLPYPLDRGGEILVYNYLRILSKTHQVTLFCFSADNTKDSDVAKVREIVKRLRVFPRRSKLSPLVIARSLLYSECYMVARHSSQEMQLAIQEEIAEHKVDIIHAEIFFMVNNIPREVKVPIVLGMENVYYQIVDRMAKKYYQRVVQKIARIESGRTQRDEIQVWNRSTVNIAISENDKEELGRINGPNHKCHVILPGVFTEQIDVRMLTERSDIIFVGSLDYHPNIDGIQFFVSEILPMIREKIPDAKIKIVGRNPGERLREYLKFHKIFLYPNVESVSGYLVDSVVEIVPLRIGGGVRMKILEALAHKVAVVSTSVGCEGLPFADNKHILIRDDPKKFAEEVVSVVSNPSKYQPMVDRAFEEVNRNHSWEVSVAKLESVYQSLGRKK